MSDPFAETIALLENRQVDEAFEKLDRLVSNSETRFDALAVRAFHHANLGRHQLALEDYVQMQEMCPPSWSLQLTIADLHMQLSNWTAALQSAAGTLLINPMLPAAVKIIQDCQHRLAVPGAEPGAARAINPVIQMLETHADTYHHGSVSPPVGQFLYVLTKLMRPSLVIETGTFVGYSGLCIAQALHEQWHGHIHCFDLFEGDHYQYASPVTGELPDNMMMVQRHFQAAGLDKYATLHKGNSAEQIAKFLKDADVKVDLAFIDGDHTMSGCMNDWSAIEPYLANGAVVVLHDTLPDGCGWLGPRLLLQKLQESGRSTYSAVNLPTLDQFGLGIVQKISDETTGCWRPSLTDLITERLYMKKRP